MKALARATSDRERAGLHDAIAIRLSHAGRLKEALAENARAVALRDTLARTDPEVRPFLAVSLSNRGRHLSALHRYVDAIVSHLRAADILSQTPDEQSFRLANNVSRVSKLLSHVRQPAMASRFGGVALDVYLVLAEQDSRYRALARAQLNDLCVSLDHAADPAHALPKKLDETRLLAVVRPSFRVASYLSQWAAAMAEARDLTLAVVELSDLRTDPGDSGQRQAHHRVSYR